jgi:polysaccharidase protein
LANVYYVDSVNGSDTNTGASADAAFKTLAAIEQIALRPGDTVLLARGSTFNEQLDIRYSGVAGSPITFGAYGEGEDPVLTGGGRGIYGSKTHYITIENLTITETTGNAIYAGGASNWVIDNVTIVDVAGGNATSGISFQQGANLTVRNSTIEGVRSDGIWVDGVKGVLLENNTIGTVFGSNSDNIQVVNSTQVVVHGNTLTMGAESDSGKGNLCINKSVDVIITDNTMVGGGYGASVNSDQVTITGNEIYGQGGYTWSFGIGIGERWSVSDYLIADNHIHDVRWGVALTGIGDTVVVRENITVTGNVFENNDGAAIKVDRPTTGTFSDNFVHVDTTVIRISDAIREAGTFVVGETQTFVSSDPTGVADLATLDETDTFTSGNVLENDESLRDLTLAMTHVEGTEVGSGARIEGEYGTLLISADGSYIYALNDSKMLGVGDIVTDTFSYAMTDGDNQGLSELVVEIAPRPNIAPVAAPDLLQLSSLNAQGNLLLNDSDANGDTLTVARVAGLDVPPEGLKVAGKYGSITVQANGEVSYVLDPVKAMQLKADALETFTYVAADGRGAMSEGLLAVTIEAPSPQPAVKPVAVNDGIAISADTGMMGFGNVLANDYDLNGGAIFLRSMGGARVGNGEVKLTGKYGDLYFEKDGDYRYVVDQNRVDGLEGSVRESFFYKISDGALQDTGSLTVKIDLGSAHVLDLDPFAMI